MPTMAELSQKKVVYVGRKALATRILSKANKLLDNCTTDLTHLAKLNLSLQENLSVLKQLDDEILDLVVRGLGLMKLNR